MLVFWLGAVVGIVAFLIAVEIRDLINVMLLLFLSGADCVIASGQSFF